MHQEMQRNANATHGRTISGMPGHRIPPKMFRHANTIALKKGGDDRDYTNVRSWRPIALLSSLGKILEAITATRLSKLAEAHRLLHQTRWQKRDTPQATR